METAKYFEAAEVRVNALMNPVAFLCHPYIYIDTKLPETWKNAKTMWTFVEIRNDGLAEKAYIYIEMPRELHPDNWTNEEIVATVTEREAKYAYNFFRKTGRKLLDYSNFEFLNVCFIRFDR